MRTYLLGTLLIFACGGHDGSAPDAATPGVYATPLSGSLPNSYTAPVTIGGHTFALVTATGSSTTAVAGAACTGCTTAGVQEYTPGAGAVDKQSTATEQYGDGATWTAEIFADAVAVGGVPAVQLELAAITSESNFFKPGGFDGLLGLGPMTLANPGTDTYPAQLAGAAVTDTLAFEFCATDGTMWVGGFDQSKASAAPSFAALDTSGQTGSFYAVDVSSMALGTTPLGTAAIGPAIVDTGTSLMFLPSAVHTGILTALNSNAAFMTLFPGQTLSDTTCVTGANVTAAQVDAMLPPLTTTIGSATLSAKASRSYLYAGATAGQFCYAVGDDSGTPPDLGVAFLRGFVTVIDLGGQRVGFAPDSGCD